MSDDVTRSQAGSRAAKEERDRIRALIETKLDAHCVDAPLRGADRPRGHDVDAEDGRSDA